MICLINGRWSSSSIRGEIILAIIPSRYIESTVYYHQYLDLDLHLARIRKKKKKRESERGKEEVKIETPP